MIPVTRWSSLVVQIFFGWISSWFDWHTKVQKPNVKEMGASIALVVIGRGVLAGDLAHEEQLFVFNFQFTPSLFKRKKEGRKERKNEMNEWVDNRKLKKSSIIFHRQDSR